MWSGALIVLDQHNSIKLWINFGSSTNTRVELLSLCVSLYISKQIGFPYLHIFGDSLVAINWENDVSSLSIINLEAWCTNIRKLLASFSYVAFYHVYREHNERVDTLSKDGLKLASGHLTLTEFSEGEVVGEFDL